MATHLHPSDVPLAEVEDYEVSTCSSDSSSDTGSTTSITSSSSDEASSSSLSGDTLGDTIKEAMYGDWPCCLAAAKRVERILTHLSASGISGEGHLEDLPPYDLLQAWYEATSWEMCEVIASWFSEGKWAKLFVRSPEDTESFRRFLLSVISTELSLYATFENYTGTIRRIEWFLDGPSRKSQKLALYKDLLQPVTWSQISRIPPLLNSVIHEMGKLLQTKRSSLDHFWMSFFTSGLLARPLVPAVIDVWADLAFDAENWGPYSLNLLEIALPYGLVAHLWNLVREPDLLRAHPDLLKAFLHIVFNVSEELKARDSDFPPSFYTDLKEAFKGHPSYEEYSTWP